MLAFYFLNPRWCKQFSILYYNYDDQGEILYGKIKNIDDLVTYEARNVEELKKAFHGAVDDYLAICSEAGKEPEKSYKGSFNVRLNAEQHRKLAIKALEKQSSLNQLIREAVEAYLNE